MKRAIKPSLDLKIDYEYLGDPIDGGWPVVGKLIHSNSVVYSFGVGENISWDEKMIERYNVSIFSFDPSPDSIDYLAKKELKNFYHHNLALSNIDTHTQFYINRNNPAGCSLIKRPEHDEVLSVKCNTLFTIMHKLGHKKIDVLKIDIEGGEYDVIDNILEEEIEIHQLLIEFHHKKAHFTVDDTQKAIKKLRNAGFKVFWSSARGREVAFINENYIYN